MSTYVTIEQTPISCNRYVTYVTASCNLCQTLKAYRRLHKIINPVQEASAKDDDFLSVFIKDFRRNFGNNFLSYKNSTNSTCAHL